MKNCSHLGLALVFLAFAACSDSHSADKKEAAKNTTATSKDESKDMKPYTPKSKEELKKVLTPQQFKVTCENGTEFAFRNEFWDNKKPGIYVDVISGAPLFSSTTKFDSGTGWPSFYAPIKKDEVVNVVDRTHGMERVEARSKTADAHLGHVFPDAHDQPGGLRYCINSASLRFVPVEKMEEEGYGEYLKLFGKEPKAAPKKEAAPPAKEAAKPAPKQP